MDDIAWSNLLQRIPAGDTAAAREAIAVVRQALSTPRGVVGYGSGLTYLGPMIGAQEWRPRSYHGVQLALAIVRGVEAADARAQSGLRDRFQGLLLELALVNADGVLASIRIPDAKAARLQTPATPPDIRIGQLHYATAAALEAAARGFVPRTGKPVRPSPALAKRRAEAQGLLKLAQTIVARFKKRATHPAAIEALALDWKKLRPKIAAARARLPK